MRILRLFITALVALVAVSAAILLTARIQEEPVQGEVSMTTPVATVAAPTPSTTPTSSTSTTIVTTTTEAPTSTTTVYVPPPTTAPPTTAAPTRVEPAPEPDPVPEPQPEPELVPEPEPQYEPAAAGCVIPAFICQRESGMSYTALNTSSGAGGMYQFLPSTWNGIARQIAPQWVGTPPHTAPPYVQDEFARFLWDGGRGCSHWSAC